jgi:hypothetical protein
VAEIWGRAAWVGFPPIDDGAEAGEGAGNGGDQAGAELQSEDGEGGRGAIEAEDGGLLEAVRVEEVKGEIAVPAGAGLDEVEAAVGNGKLTGGVDIYKEAGVQEIERAAGPGRRGARVPPR